MIGKFVRGNTEFDCNSAPYTVMDFVPPAAVYARSIASGTSANVYGGGSLVSEKAQNRPVTFRVRVEATATQSAKWYAKRLMNYLSMKGGDPLYWHYSDYDVPEPLWGQFGAPLRYEVVSADPLLWDDYYIEDARDQTVIVEIALEVKPYALGRPQRLASAMGGVWLDTIGTEDGQAKGLRVMPATTNKMTNPAFSHATWNTNWTAGSSLIVTQNKDPRYCYPGSGSSALIISRAGTNNTYTQSINAGNTNKHSFSAIVYRPDGAAVTASDCQIYYQSARSSTYQSLGEGFYLVYADNLDGINSAQAAGLLIASGRSVYLLAFQMEEKAAHTPITFGDMLGSAWSGTVAESTSARTAGRVRIPVASDTFVNNLWSVHWVWTPDAASTAQADSFFWSAGTANIRCQFNNTGDTISLLDNSGTAVTSAVAWSAGDVIEGLAVGGNAGLAIYAKNHTTGNTYSGTAAYVVPAAADYIYIGTDSNAANHSGGIYSLFETYNDDLTAANNTALQAAVGKVVGVKVGDIPWLWTKDGDDAVDNYDDSTHDNWCVTAGIPGDIPSLTDMKLTADASKWNVALWLGQHVDALNHWRNPSTTWWVEMGGSAEAGISNGDYNALAALPVADYANMISTVPFPDDISGNFHFFTSIKTGTGEATVYLKKYLRTNNGYVGGVRVDKTVNSDYYYLLYVGSLSVPLDNVLADGERTIKPQIQISKTTDSQRIDFGAFIQGKLMKVTNSAGDYPPPDFVIAYPVWYRIKGGTVQCDNTSMTTFPAMTGEVIALEPNRYNLMQSFVATTTMTYTRTFTYTAVSVTPRWEVL